MSLNCELKKRIVFFILLLSTPYGTLPNIVTYNLYLLGIPHEKVSINFIKTIPKEEQPWPANKRKFYFSPRLAIFISKNSAFWL